MGKPVVSGNRVWMQAKLSAGGKVVDEAKEFFVDSGSPYSFLSRANIVPGMVFAGVFYLGRSAFTPYADANKCLVISGAKVHTDVDEDGEEEECEVPMLYCPDNHTDTLGLDQQIVFDMWAVSPRNPHVPWWRRRPSPVITPRRGKPFPLTPEDIGKLGKWFPPRPGKPGFRIRPKPGTFPKDPSGPTPFGPRPTTPSPKVPPPPPPPRIPRDAGGGRGGGQGEGKGADGKKNEPGLPPPVIRRHNVVRWPTHGDTGLEAQHTDQYLHD